MSILKMLLSGVYNVGAVCFFGLISIYILSFFFRALQNHGFDGLHRTTLVLESIGAILMIVFMVCVAVLVFAGGVTLTIR
ncbi:hypothetical protein JAG27_002488 [Proteus mirabilis]|nr:hypothetical protein [Proteus mirabilis]